MFWPGEQCSSVEELQVAAASSVLAVQSAEECVSVPFASGFKHKVLHWFNYVYLLHVGTVRIN